MKQKGKFSPVILLFFLFIFAVPIFWVVRGKVDQVDSLIEYRTLASFPRFPVDEIKTSVKHLLQGNKREAFDILNGLFVERSYQNDFETATPDQIPYRSEAILISNTFDRQIIRLAYPFFKDPAIPTGMRAGIYQMQDDGRLIIPPVSFGPAEMAEIDLKITSYKDLIAANPGVNFYLLYIDVIESSEFNPLNADYPDADSGRSFAYFDANKPEGLNVGRLAFSSYEDYKKYFFRSDHHWNIHGTLKGYEIVYNMVVQNYPDISPMHPIDSVYTFPDIEFLGSWARTAYYPIQPADKFEVALLNFPPYRVFDKEGNEIDYNKHDEYFAGDYLTVPFTDHYIEYHGSDHVDLIEYVFENGASKNLLLVGDSYINPFEPIMASHYHHTYSLDPRRWRGIDLSLSEFRKDHQVDDVIIVGGPGITVYRAGLTVKP